MTANLIDELRKKEPSKNNGMGVNCIRSIILYLDKGDADSAYVVCSTENDKIRNYPDLQHLLYRIVPRYFKDYVNLCTMFKWEIDDNFKDLLEKDNG